MRTGQERPSTSKAKLAYRKEKRNRPEVYLRRSPFLVCYWHQRNLVFENFLTRHRVAASAEAAAILDFFSRWKPRNAMFRHWPRYTRASLQAVVNSLVSETLLQRSGRKNPPEDGRHKSLLAWSAWNPSASFFHFTTKDVYSPKITVEEIRYLKGLARKGPAPLPLKSYSGARTIPLERAKDSSEFSRVLRERRTWRQFARQPVDELSFATLMDLSFRVQSWLPVRNIGRLALKTSPSGGALHPCEAYVLARRVAGVAPGIYHYDAGSHRLQRVRTGASAREVEMLLAGQWWFRGAAFVVFLTAVFARTQWKYDYPRAYRAVLAEAGHLCQTFCLTATWLGLAPFCTMALADSKIEKALKIDGVSESVLYAMGAGRRPGGQ